MANALIIGNGGREHALAWKVAQSPSVETVYVAPGNAGTLRESKVENVDIAVDDITALVDFAQNNNVSLTIIGPELPLVLGIVDAFQDAGLNCFGPGREAAQLEGSKAFTKAFLKRHNIPTAEYESFSDFEAAKAYLLKKDAPIVIKADGLAAGKGVILAQTTEEAIEAVRQILVEKVFGDAGASLVIEEFLYGEEASFICMSDGKNILPMATSQDHKAAHNGDQGPNTGGMGAYSPAPVVDDIMYQRIMEQVIEPTIKGLADEGMPYTGFLYAGIMIDKVGTPKVLEYNCRFGDPETQPILLRLKSDLVQHCMAAIAGELDQETAEWDQRAALGVVLAAEGYPGDYPKGAVICGLDDADDESSKVFHAGVADKDGDCVTNGGRVLCATALGNSVSEAQALAYSVADKISWDGMWYRTDIGYRAVARESNN